MAQPSSSADSHKIIAQKTWELSNKIETVNTVDEIYRYDKQQQQDILTAKPWEKEYVKVFSMEFSKHSVSVPTFLRI